MPSVLQTTLAASRMTESDLALVKWFDSVQDDVGRTEQIFASRMTASGCGEGINCRISRNHCTGRDKLLGHPIEWKVCCDGRE